MPRKRLRDKIVLALSASLLLYSPTLAQNSGQTDSAAGTTGSGTAAVPQTYAERMAAEEAKQEKQAAENAANQRRADAEAAKERKADEALDQEHKSASQPSSYSVPRSSAKSETSAPAPTIKLYGRIEELSSGVGARIPLKMQAMTPIRDTSLDQKLSAKATTLAAKATANTVQSYPIDFRGSWTGDITINSSNFDPTYFQTDAVEARKEADLMKPGTKGRYTVTFFQGGNNKIQMQPSQVMFQGTDSMGSQMKMLERSNPQMSAMFGNNSMMANMQMPIQFSLHMGTPITSGETSVTGNQMSSDLMKNTLRELKAGVLESEIVTREHERDAETGNVKNGFSESVLRFTRLSNSQIYLQAAYVYYRNDGKFQAKYMFYGTLDRSNGQAAGYSQPANPFGGLMPGLGGGGGGANPFGGLLPGGGGGGGAGAGNIQQQMQQMQDMLKKMGGH